MLLLILGLVSGNILDNIFANFDSPYIHIPNDFHVVLGTERTSSPNQLIIDYSTTLKACHIRVIVDLIGEVANAYINMTTNEVYLRRYKSLVPPQMQCQIYEGLSVSDKLQLQSGSNAIILEPDVVFHLMSMYMGTGDDDMARFELSSLLQGRNKAYALFYKGNLDSIELEFENKRTLKLYVIEDLEQRSFTTEQFKVPWPCEPTDINLMVIIEELSAFIKQ